MGRCCKRKLSSYAAEFLRFISVGQYQQKLYHKKLGMHSSISGGLLTFIATIILCIYAYLTLKDTIDRIQHNVYMSYQPFNHQTPLKEFKENLLDPTITISTRTSKTKLGNCSDYLLGIAYFTDETTCLFYDLFEFESTGNTEFEKCQIKVKNLHYLMSEIWDSNSFLVQNDKMYQFGVQYMIKYRR